MTAGGNSFKNATAHKVNSYYTLNISYCRFCVGKHTILGPANMCHGYRAVVCIYLHDCINCHFVLYFSIVCCCCLCITFCWV